MNNLYSKKKKKTRRNIVYLVFHILNIKCSLFPCPRITIIFFFYCCTVFISNYFIYLPIYTNIIYTK